MAQVNLLQASRKLWHTKILAKWSNFAKIFFAIIFDQRRVPAPHENPERPVCMSPPGPSKHSTSLDASLKTSVCMLLCYWGHTMTQWSGQHPSHTGSSHTGHFRGVRALHSQGTLFSGSRVVCSTSIMGWAEGTSPHKARGMPVASHERTTAAGDN